MNEIVTNLTLELRPEMLLRVALSLLAGLTLGIKYDRRAGVAGMRGTVLIASGTCLAMIVSDALYGRSLAQFAGIPSWQVIALSLLAAGAVMCLGFVGAGALVHQGKHLLDDAATAAALWLSALVGLSFGAGEFGIGFLAAVATGFIHLLIPRIGRLTERDDAWWATPSSNPETSIQTHIHPMKTKTDKTIASNKTGDADGKTDRKGTLEELTRHLASNQIFPSDLKNRQKDGTVKTKRVKSRRIIAYMF